MKKLLYFSVIAAMALSFTSCGTTKPLYSWYNYEDVAYEYNKTPTDERRASVIAQYQKLIDNQKGVRGVVPPGMYAEYGYLLYKTGKKQEGIGYLKKEISLYPESENYISRIINQLEK
ncbi:MAG: DUF4810 domain-containing protein [Prevotella sp.]|jgi:hypothetical protein|nr:DUF4810 domain-containing protein [Prevotella sp.]